MSLPERLCQAGYRERSLSDLLRVEELYALRDAGPRTLCQESAAAHLAAFWLLNQPRDRELLQGLMGAETLEELERLGLVAATTPPGEGVPLEMTARALLFPCLGRCLFTDLFAPAVDPMVQVYWLGGDSMVLARATPRAPVRRALDLCTGSGVHAVLAAAHADEVWGVDVNARALEFSRINARVNKVGEPCRFVQGSLYEPLPEGRFDLITANPPFVPTPRGDLALFRPGGQTGEEVTRAIVGGLPERLEVGGTLTLVSQHPVMRHSHVLDRVEGWLGGAAGWGLAYLVVCPIDRDDLIASHLIPRLQFLAELGPEEGARAYRREFERWLDSYAESGIVAADLGLIYVRRLAPGHPGWRAEHRLPFPREPISDWVQSWLDAQDRFSAPIDWEWRPAWSPFCTRLRLDPRTGEGFVDRIPTLSPESAFLLERADGARTARELKEAFANRFGHKEGVAERLAELARRALLR
ncbi:MAG: methyltransferase [Candidatus Eremiobacterota bacterium]